jgi:hypothetical protein
MLLGVEGSNPLSGRDLTMKFVPGPLNVTVRTHLQRHTALVYLSDILSSVAHCANFNFELGKRKSVFERVERACEEITQFLVSQTSVSFKILVIHKHDGFKGLESR